MRPAAFALIVLLAGCASSDDPGDFQPVSSQNALVRWQRKSVTLIREADFSRSANGGMRLLLGAQSPPLLELHLDPNGFLTARGRLADRGWSGPAAKAPLPLSTWATLAAVFQRANDLPQGEHEYHTVSARIAIVKTGDALQSLSILNTDTGETLSASFK